MLKIIETRKDSKRIQLVIAIASIALTLAASSPAAACEGDGPPDREKFHAAVEQCATENNITLERGTRPTDEQRAVIDTCLKEKGLQPPSNRPQE